MSKEMRLFHTKFNLRYQADIDALPDFVWGCAVGAYMPGWVRDHEEVHGQRLGEQMMSLVYYTPTHRDFLRTGDLRDFLRTGDLSVGHHRFTLNGPVEYRDLVLSVRDLVREAIYDAFFLCDDVEHFNGASSVYWLFDTDGPRI